MRKLSNTFLVALAAVLMVSTSMAQPGEGRDDRGPGARGPRDGDQRGPRDGDRGPRDRGPRDRGPSDRGPGGSGFRPPVSPLVGALDTNKDGTISADEIKNAPAALKKLDKNKDGKLSRDELRPQFDRRPGGPGGRGQGEGRRRPDGDRRPDEGRPPRRPDGEGPRGEGRPDRGGQFNPQQVVDRIFNNLDKNKDGKIGKDEAQGRMKERFDVLDANNDGSVSKEEMKKAFANFGGRPGGDRPRRPGGEGRPRRPGGEDGDRPRRPARPDEA